MNVENNIADNIVSKHSDQIYTVGQVRDLEQCQ